MEGCQGQFGGFPAPLRRFAVIFRIFRGGIYLAVCIPSVTLVLSANTGGGVEGHLGLFVHTKGRQRKGKKVSWQGLPCAWRVVKGYLGGSRPQYADSRSFFGLFGGYFLYQIGQSNCAKGPEGKCSKYRFWRSLGQHMGLS